MPAPSGCRCWPGCWPGRTASTIWTCFGRPRPGTSERDSFTSPIRIATSGAGLCLHLPTRLPGATLGRSCGPRSEPPDPESPDLATKEPKWKAPTGRASGNVSTRDSRSHTRTRHDQYQRCQRSSAGLRFRLRRSPGHRLRGRGGLGRSRRPPLLPAADVDRSW